MGRGGWVLGTTSNTDAVVLLSLRAGVLPHRSLFGWVGALRFVLRLLRHGRDAPLRGGMKQPFVCSAALLRPLWAGS